MKRYQLYFHILLSYCLTVNMTIMVIRTLQYFAHSIVLRKSKLPPKQINWTKQNPHSCMSYQGLTNIVVTRLFFLLHRSSTSPKSMDNWNCLLKTCNHIFHMLTAVKVNPRMPSNPCEGGAGFFWKFPLLSFTAFPPKVSPSTPELNEDSSALLIWGPRPNISVCSCERWVAQTKHG